MSTSIIELRKKPHTSISAVKTFLTCPRKYHLHYKLHAKPDFLPAALVLGSCWHEAVAGWLDGADTDEVLDARLGDAIRERLREQLEVPVLFDDDAENEESFIAKAIDMFRCFRAAAPRPKKVIATEVAFSLEVGLNDELLPFPVVGAIDAIVFDDADRPVVWELKTGKKKWSSDQTEFDLQPTLYRRAARELGFSRPELRLLVTTKSKAPDLQVVDLARSDADEEEMVGVILGVHRAIRAGVTHPVRGWQCRTCQYATSCRP